MWTLPINSPHLIETRERIRINGKNLSKEKFVNYFWHCYNTIDTAVRNATTAEINMPFYFSFLTTMMFYVFIQEQVDVAVVEVGIGGEFDCTNVIQKPVVCGITSLGFDHEKLLGNTIEEIAWNKAGIFKAYLSIAPLLEDYPQYPFPISLDGEVQKNNASLAIQLVYFWLAEKGLLNKNHPLVQWCEDKNTYTENIANCVGPVFQLEDFVFKGLAGCQWPGRNQIFDRNNVTYYIDGAHTQESIEQCKNWFLSKTRDHSSDRTILVFYCSNDRNPATLLLPLLDCEFDEILFCSPTVIVDTNVKDDNDQWRLSTSMQLERQRLSTHVEIYNQLPWSNKLPSVNRAVRSTAGISKHEKNAGILRHGVLLSARERLVIMQNGMEDFYR
ncbi:unnamed protein product, partial [Didymodactylos carnosus]